MQTQIRLLLQEQSDQGLHYLPFHLHHFDAFLHCKPSLLFFRTNTVINLCVPIFKISAVVWLLITLVKPDKCLTRIRRKVSKLSKGEYAIEMRLVVEDLTPRAHQTHSI